MGSFAVASVVRLIGEMTGDGGIGLQYSDEETVQAIRGGPKDRRRLNLAKGRRWSNGVNHEQQGLGFFWER